MKTDLERFIELYESFGITLKALEKGNENDKYFLIEMAPTQDSEGEMSVSKKFDGQFGHYSEILFDGNGKFIKQGFWV